MKKILFSLGFIFLSTLMMAQSSDRAALVDQAVKKAGIIYHLNAAQKAEMKVIAARELRNLDEIESLKTTDAKKYLIKKKGIMLASEGSLKRLLVGDQLKILNDQKVARRKKESALIKEMKVAGLTKEEMELKLLETY